MLGWLKRVFGKRAHADPVVSGEVKMIFQYPDHPIDYPSPYELHLQRQHEDRAARIKEEYASWIANCKAVNELLNRQNTSRKHLRLVA